MHRFRKKSDAKRGDTTAAGIGVALHPQPLPSFSPIVTQEVQINPPLSLPSLPPVDDFRTSLILPDLTKRFTLLRSSSGDPVSLDDLRSRFAQQRARGAENQISEEEEDMLLDMLSRIRAGNAGGSTNSSYVKSEPSSAGYATSEFTQSGGIRSSTQSTSTMGSNTTYEPSYGSASPSSRASKRHSNNLFAGQFRDLRYMRKPAARMGSTRSVLSNSPSESTMGSTTNAVIDSYADGYRPVTPDNSTPSISAASSPSSVGTPTRSTVLSHLSVEEGKYGGWGKLPNAQLKRISVSLKEVIKEIEEEAEDDVVFPRTSISSQQTQQQTANKGEPEPSKGAVAVTTDDDDENAPSAITDGANEPAAMWKADADRPGSATGYRSPSPYRAGGSTSPVPRVPGYIPGMPRPVTPAREMEMDDVRSHSTTPRAASPTALLNRTTTSPFAVPATTLLRGASNASSIARPGSPLKNIISQKSSTNGSPTEERQLNGFVTEYVQPSAHWRRPSSPLSNNVFSSFSNGSRPSTPSNSNWALPAKPAGQPVKSLGRNGTLLGHNKNQSTTSVSEVQDRVDTTSSNGIKGASRLPQQQQPYSPQASTTDEDNLILRSKFLSNGSSLPMASYDHDDRQTSSSGSDRFARSPTPTHDPAKSPNMGSGIDDTPRRNQRVLSPFATPPSSPFAHKSTSSNPLFISPMSNNSSRSSLVSAGSSYHSWEEENGFSAGFISTLNQTDAAWHDVSSKPTADDPEKILQQFTGLSKGDLLVIQTKLLDAAQTRAKNAEVRSPSTLRRRRPSTAQSIQSYGGIPSRTTSPAPQIANQFTYQRPSDSSAKASALLNSVLDSIDSSEQPIIPKFDANGQFVASSMEESEEPPPKLNLPPVQPEPSSPARRNKDLADIIFGSGSAASSSSTNDSVSEIPEKVVQTHELVDIERGPIAETIIPVQPVAPSTSERTVRQGDIEVTDAPSKATVAMDPNELIRQVQERTEAAMAQLHRSPRQGVFPSAGSPIIRRRINPHDISGPLNVQSSASIDKIPTVALSANQSTANLQRSNTSTKLSLSKRLRNTLRSKPSQPNGDEVTPWTADNASSSSISRANGNRSLTPSKALGSTSDLKTTNPSPPSSAGPSSLKGFMSRFRRKGQADPVSESVHRNGSYISSTHSHSPVDRHIPSTPLSAPPSTIAYSHLTSPRSTTQTLPSPSSNLQNSPPNSYFTPGSPGSQLSVNPPANEALQQFLKAGIDLGLNQADLNEILARSQPKEQRSSDMTFGGTLTRNNSLAAKSLLGPQAEGDEASRLVSSIPEVIVEQAADLGRKPSQRQYAGSPVPAPRRVREIADAHANPGGAIVRRTIIFPSANGSTTDLSTLLRKVSKRSKRVSGLSMQSNRSVHDRVPTPPPLKVKRLSTDTSPPVPTMPSWTGQNTLTAPRPFPESNTEKSNSIYDFYDMYAGDRTGSSQAQELFEPPRSPTAESMPETETGQGIELIELDTGETIWQIVNGLRADDAESLFQHRVSFSSEFSGGAHDSDGEQLFFKEHTRNASKSSSISGFTRKKTASPALTRPETKVFYSSSAHIARLIDQLSRTTEAGAFDIKPKRPTGPGHSHSGSLQSDSDFGLPVEERLERMLDSINSTAH